MTILDLPDDILLCIFECLIPEWAIFMNYDYQTHRTWLLSQAVSRMLKTDNAISSIDERSFQILQYLNIHPKLERLVSKIACNRYRNVAILVSEPHASPKISGSLIYLRDSRIFPHLPQSFVRLIQENKIKIIVQRGCAESPLSFRTVFPRLQEVVHLKPDFITHSVRSAARRIYLDAGVSHYMGPEELDTIHGRHTYAWKLHDVVANLLEFSRRCGVRNIYETIEHTLLFTDSDVGEEPQLDQRSVRGRYGAKHEKAPVFIVPQLEARKYSRKLEQYLPGMRWYVVNK